MHFYNLGAHSVIFAWFLLTMDTDELGLSAQPSFRGFRKRWATNLQVDASEDPSQVFVDDSAQLSGNFSSADIFDSVSLPSGWDKISEDGLDNRAETEYEPESPLDMQPEDVFPRVTDPCRFEPSWKQCAMASASKRLKVDLPKLPWEMPEFYGAFRSGDKWAGTGLAGCSRVFLPTAIGLSDVLHSEVVQEAAKPEAVVQFEPPVIRLELKRARKELPDEDIRRLALCKLRSLILQDPLASQLGESIYTMLNGGCSQALVEQSLSDCFRSKASSTLQKRASSLWRLSKILRSLGVLNPLRMSEENLYAALCAMREDGAGATTAQHMIEAIHFLDSTIKLRLMDVRAVVSGRCKGVARDMYLTKSPLTQKQPLRVDHVRCLETKIKDMTSALQCIAGQILFCIHACCRWKDAQRLKSLAIESGHGETLIHADALASKTALSAEQKTRFTPYVALGTGVSQCDWGTTWLDARAVEGLDFYDFTLPSYSERSFRWTESPMSASEATCWLRDFLSDMINPSNAFQYGSHSCKTTVLTWAGRCTQVPFSPAERRLLGHHLEPGMKSVMTYSRESYTNLYSRVLMMFRLIRSGEFNPDLSALERVVLLSDSVCEANMGDTLQPPVEQADISDSESSVASETGEAGEECFAPGAASSQELTSLFPDFPGVPESSLMVHKTSGLVHAMNEDGFLMCGRLPSINFKMYSTLVVDRNLCEGCSQCKRAFSGQPAIASEP